MALIICPDCGKEFSEFAKQCPNCGRPTETIKLVLCPNCGTKNREIAKFCKTCGRNIQETQLAIVDRQERDANAILVFIKSEKVSESSLDGKPCWIIPLNIGIVFETKTQTYEDEVWVSFSKLKDEENFSFNFNIDETEVFVMLRRWKELEKMLNTLYYQLKEIKKMDPRINFPDYKIVFKFDILRDKEEEVIYSITSDIVDQVKDLFREKLKDVLKIKKDELEGFEGILKEIKDLKKEVNIEIKVQDGTKGEDLVSFPITITFPELPEKTFQTDLKFSLKPTSSSILIEIEGIKVGVEIGDTKEFGKFLNKIITDKLKIYKTYGVSTKINADIYAPSESVSIELVSSNPLKEIFSKIIDLVKNDLIEMWGETLKGRQEIKKLVEEGKKITPKEWVEEKLGKDKFKKLEEEINSKGYYVDEVTNLMIQEYPLDKNFYLITKR